MKNITKSIMFALIMSISGMAHANLALNNISESDLENVIKDFTAVFNHSTLSPASSLGTVFGMEFGVGVGMASVPGVKSLAAEAGESVDALPGGTLFYSISVPMGFTIEVGYLPSLELGAGASFSNSSFAAKWTMTDTLVDLPVDLALKVSSTNSALEFTQTISSVETKTKFKETVTEFSVFASKSFGIVEPYVGLGTVTADGQLSVDGSTSIFDTTFTTNTSASAKPTGMSTYLGVQANLLIFRLGYEYSKLFDASKHNVKFAFYF